MAVGLIQFGVQKDSGDFEELNEWRWNKQVKLDKIVKDMRPKGLVERSGRVNGFEAEEALLITG